jgi:hypothetical protein
MITGTLHLRYIITGAVLYCLVAGGMAIAGFRAWISVPWFIACSFWLFTGVATYQYLQNVRRTVRWFRLEGEILVYRKLGSAREYTLLLSQVRKLEAVEPAKSSRLSGFNLVRAPDGRRLYFAFLPGAGGRELFAELNRRQEVVAATAEDHSSTSRAEQNAAPDTGGIL